MGRPGQLSELEEGSVDWELSLHRVYSRDECVVVVLLFQARKLMLELDSSLKWFLDELSGVFLGLDRAILGAPQFCCST